MIGTVKDASGAVVANADIVLIDLATGTSKEIKSGPEGGFVIPNLQPGRYTLTATAAGFQPQTIQEVVVETSRVTDVVVQFQVAGVTEQVNVEGRSSVVETSSSDDLEHGANRANREAADRRTQRSRLRAA